MLNNKKMWKVISPVEKDGAVKYWMRLGSAFTNKDDSINVYLDAVPTTKGFTLQLRELTEDDLRERADKRSSYTSRGTLGPSLASLPQTGGGAVGPNADIPF